MAKYGEHIASAGFGTPEQFAAMFSVAIVIAPTRLPAFARTSQPWPPISVRRSR